MCIVTHEWRKQRASSLMHCMLLCQISHSERSTFGLPLHGWCYEWASILFKAVILMTSSLSSSSPPSSSLSSSSTDLKSSSSSASSSSCAEVSFTYFAVLNELALVVFALFGCMLDCERTNFVGEQWSMVGLCDPGPKESV